MNTRKGWTSELMLAFFTAEATYDAGVTMNDANSCSMQGFELEVAYEDDVVNDKAEVTGAEHGTDQEINTQGVKFTYKEPKVKPNTLAGLAALAMGDITSTKDGAFDAYAHKIVPVAEGSALPSIQVEHKKGALQRAYKGVKCDSLKISAEAGGYVSVEAGLIGSGTRDTSATAMTSKISESWLKTSNCKVWLESAGNIDIESSLNQDAEDISSATPEDLKIRIKSFEFNFMNNLERQIGFGGVGVAHDIDYARRAIELKMSLIFLDATEYDYYINQDALAVELDLKGAIVDAGSTTYFGFHLIVPRFKLKAPPLAIGGPGDILTVDLDGDVQDDGTNDACIIEVYTAQAAYMG